MTPHADRLEGLLPLWVHCRTVCDNFGYWNTAEEAFRTCAEFSHRLCPDYITHLYPQVADEEREASARKALEGDQA